MKFVHIADMHFDAPFVALTRIEGLSEKRRLEQRYIFRKIIDYIIQNKVEYFFISGDLYEHEYVRKSTIEYINNLFKLIPDTKIFISPGNHDPFLKNSYYNKFNWNSNVYIFKNEIEKVEESDINIYGYGFNDFYSYGIDIDNIQLEYNEKPNIFVVHGSLDSGLEKEREYNPIKSKMLKSLKFDYVALGHVHKTNYLDNTNIVYPGSTISFGFDELGKHGMIIGEINKKTVKTEFISLDEREFKEFNLDISDIMSKEGLIEKLNDLDLKINVLYKIVLTGNKNFNVDTYEVLKLISNKQILKIKDLTRYNIAIEELAKEINLRGLFLKEILELDKEKYSEEIIKRAIDIGLDVLE